MAEGNPFNSRLVLLISVACGVAMCALLSGPAVTETLFEAAGILLMTWSFPWACPSLKVDTFKRRLHNLYTHCKKSGAKLLQGVYMLMTTALTTLCTAKALMLSCSHLLALEPFHTLVAIMESCCTSSDILQTSTRAPCTPARSACPQMPCALDGPVLAIIKTCPQVVSELEPACSKSDVVEPSTPERMSCNGNSRPTVSCSCSAGKSGSSAATASRSSSISGTISSTDSSTSSTSNAPVTVSRVSNKTGLVATLAAAYERKLASAPSHYTSTPLAVSAAMPGTVEYFRWCFDEMSASCQVCGTAATSVHDRLTAEDLSIRSGIVECCASMWTARIEALQAASCC